MYPPPVSVAVRPVGVTLRVGGRLSSGLLGAGTVRAAFGVEPFVVVVTLACVAADATVAVATGVAGEEAAPVAESEAAEIPVAGAGAVVACPEAVEHDDSASAAVSVTIEASRRDDESFMTFRLHRWA
ncbi:MAG: hypothetical protein Q4G51_12660 [Dermatophilus congolensis]|nr:hypothetical protein [Dermatophilus congolensis]